MSPISSSRLVALLAALLSIVVVVALFAVQAQSPQASSPGPLKIRSDAARLASGQWVGQESGAIGYGAGWSFDEKTHRWTDGEAATLTIEVPAERAGGAALELSVVTHGPQRVIARVGGGAAPEQKIESLPGEPVVLRIEGLATGTNTIVLALPDARRPANGDARQLALALKALRLTAR